MKSNKHIQAVEAEFLKTDIPSFKVGDSIDVHTRIVEGEKERVQVFTGTVIARRGTGVSETVALYRVTYGTGVERVFMIHSPKIAKIVVGRKGDVRKGKLYYLRGTAGKASKVKELIVAGRKKGAAKEAAAKEAAAKEGPANE